MECTKSPVSGQPPLILCKGHRAKPVKLSQKSRFLSARLPQDLVFPMNYPTFVIDTLCKPVASPPFGGDHRVWDSAWCPPSNRVQRRRSSCSSRLECGSDSGQVGSYLQANGGDGPQQIDRGNAKIDKRSPIPNLRELGTDLLFV